MKGDPSIYLHISKYSDFCWPILWAWGGQNTTTREKNLQCKYLPTCGVLADILALDWSVLRYWSGTGLYYGTGLVLVCTTQRLCITCKDHQLFTMLQM